MDVRVAVFVAFFVRTIIFAPPCIAAPSESDSVSADIDRPDDDGNCTTKNACDKCIRTYGCIWCSDPDVNVERCQQEEHSKCDPEFVTPQNKSKHSIKEVQDTPRIVNITLRPSRYQVFHTQATIVLMYECIKISQLPNFYTIELIPKDSLSRLMQKLSPLPYSEDKNGKQKPYREVSELCFIFLDEEIIRLPNRNTTQDTGVFVLTGYLHILCAGIREPWTDKGHPLSITLNYVQVKDHPLDIYYILDLSDSLKTEALRGQIFALGDEIAKKISNMTKNLQLGIGSFVDKPIMPYTFTAPEQIVKLTEKTKHEPTYNFRNHLPLSHKSFFSNAAKNLTLSFNNDAPDGGLDAILQAAVCGKKIGWRDNSRKLIVFTSNSPFHIAGDGKLGGIVTPNDGCCHLNERGYYDFDTVQDYPSISQLKAVLKNESINVIFAVDENSKILFKMLTDTLDEAFLGIKNPNNNADITRIIEEQYHKITSSVKIRSKDLGDHLKLKYYSSCLNVNSPPKETKKCEGLQINSAVKFTVEVELISCPKNSAQWNQTFYIELDGVTKERTTVNVKMQCDCECNKPWHPLYQEHAINCSSHGTLKCGLCDCDHGYSDSNCSCPLNDGVTTGCRPDDNAPLCSERGTCICNKCHCNSWSPTEGFSGKYCECNNFSCPRNEGLLCSDTGKCGCNGTCVCDDDWIHEDCSCENRTSNCIALSGSDEEICSGHGDCVCNKCVCRKNGDYSGKYCEKCPNCRTKCDELESITQCIHRYLKLSDQKHCYENYTYNITHTMVKDLQDVTDLDDYITCKQTDDLKCSFFSAYKIYGKQIEVKVWEGTQCDTQATSPLTVVLIILWSIVAGGLICLLIWKAFAVAQDRREYAKFEAEQSAVMWGEATNPLYKDPSTKFQNPLFVNSSRHDDSQNLGLMNFQFSKMH